MYSKNGHAIRARNGRIRVNADISRIEDRLEAWANWLKSGNHRSIGFPSIAAFLIIYTGFSIPVTGSNPEAEETDRLICKMPPRLKRVIIARYLYGHSDRQGSVVLHMDRRTFKTRADAGLLWLGKNFTTQY